MFVSITAQATSRHPSPWHKLCSGMAVLYARICEIHRQLGASQYLSRFELDLNHVKPMILREEKNAIRSLNDQDNTNRIMM